MTAQERLAAALPKVIYGEPVVGATALLTYEETAVAILAADPRLAQDIEDGAALRRLREALPEGVVMRLENLLPDTPTKPGCVWSLDLERDDHSDEVGPLFDLAFDAPTIAAAADKAREALEQRS